MKVAILGNMNNNGFALMRYLRDLGVDAHLLLYGNDGTGSLAHFTPDHDSFGIEGWSKYIHHTCIYNNAYHTFPGFIQIIAQQLYNLKGVFVGRANRLYFLSEKAIKNTLLSYKYVISSGYGPGVLHRANIKIDIFSPYAVGIEGVWRFFAPDCSDLGNRLIFELGRYYQLKSLKMVKHIVTADTGITAVELGKHNLNFVPVAMPMVYVESDYPDRTGDRFIDNVGALLERCDFSALMHCRLAWTSNICDHNRLHSKNNDWVIRSFRSLLDELPTLNARLVILEYGPDVYNTKLLVDQLGLLSHVVWLPKTSRKNLMWLLRKVNLGIGEFIESPRMIWGGTGWEVLACGKPLLQGFFFENGEYEALFDQPEPPLLKVRSQDDVTKHLLEMARHPEKASEIGLASKAWFQTYNGINLAKKWLDLLLDRPRNSDTLPLQSVEMTPNG